MLKMFLDYLPAFLGAFVNAVIVILLLDIFLKLLLKKDKKTTFFYSYLLYIILISVLSSTVLHISPWPYIISSTIFFIIYITFQNKKIKKEQKELKTQIND